MKQVKVKKLHPDAIIPKYATAGAACFDLHSIQDGYVSDMGESSLVFDTGLAFEIPDSHVMLIFSRSGHGFKNNVRLANAIGVIDADYRGQVKVKLTADDDGELDVIVGDRIAQAMILPVQRIELLEVEDLSHTERGAGGFGSTGK